MPRDVRDVRGVQGGGGVDERDAPVEASSWHVGDLGCTSVGLGLSLEASVICSRVLAFERASCAGQPSWQTWEVWCLPH